AFCGSHLDGISGAVNASGSDEFCLVTGATRVPEGPHERHGEWAVEVAQGAGLLVGRQPAKAGEQTKILAHLCPANDSQPRGESGRGEHGDQGSGGGGIRGSGIEAQSRAPVAAVDAGGREGGGVSSDLGWGWFPELQLIGKEIIIVAAGKQLMDDVQSD